MLRTFNCGLGLVICVAKEDAEQTISILNSNNESASIIGEIVNKAEGEPSVSFA